MIGLKIQVNLDPKCEELEVTIRTHELTKEVNQLVDTLRGGSLKRIIGIRAQPIGKFMPRLLRGHLNLT
ncbi:hypothetical protein EDD58_102396 [Hazenella coriacea]|uniref:Uncharacterized protein n=1 Tax=Hazenella coriacea TaxID=1179467 RepID=A0A4R3L9M7_9BACL|nr:hypothetical protein EDD58_102396 [Hazenella coriacea]